MIRLLAGLACLVFVSVAPCQAGSGALVYDQPVHYRVEFGYTISSATPLPALAEIWLPYPVDRPAQRIRGLTAAPAATETSRQPACFYWRMAEVAQSPLAATESFELTAWHTWLDRSRYRPRPYNTRSKEYQRWTGSSPHIELSDPWIVGQAQKLLTDHPDPLERARAAYDLVADHMSYVRIYRFGGAAYAAKEGKGECGDYSCLFAALCRKTGIPARPVVGYWANTLNEPHVWAEFYLEGVGWIPCDPSQGDLSDRDRFFGQLDNQRVILNHDVDITLPYGFAEKVSPMFQSGVFWLKGGTNVKIAAVLHAVEIQP